MELHYIMACYNKCTHTGFSVKKEPITHTVEKSRFIKSTICSKQQNVTMVESTEQFARSLPMIS